MNFGVALSNLKDGNRVQRKGWNDQYLGIIDGGGFRDGYRTQDFIYAKTKDDHITPWMPTHKDLLAEDWEVVDWI